MERYSTRLTMLMPVLIIGTILGSTVLAAAVHPGEDFVGAGFGILWATCMAGLGGGLHYGLGFLMNSRSTADGRRWHNRYVIGGLPVQYAGIYYVVFAWCITAWNVGKATSAWLGWGLFLLLPIAAAGIATWRNHRWSARRQRRSPGS